jgi:TorA maturation chaperone TorD
MKEHWIEYLTGEALVLSLMGRILQQYPDPDWLDPLIHEGVFEEPAFAAGQSSLVEGLQLLTDWTDEVSPKLSGEALDTLRTDFTRLFLGPGKLILPPWESTFFNEERLIFQEQMLKVRQWYSRYGLESEKIHNEPDDHIGLEMSFVAHLASVAIEAIENEDEQGFEDALNSQKRFLKEHLLRWGPKWCQRLSQDARTTFYKGVAGVTLGALLDLKATFEIEPVEAPFI